MLRPLRQARVDVDCGSEPFVQPVHCATALKVDKVRLLVCVGSRAVDSMIACWNGAFWAPPKAVICKVTLRAPDD